MGACDAGRCCKGNTCSDDKKCCCTAGKKGTHTAGEVCRTASCQYSSGNCDDNVNVCECESNGGTLSQSCDPCANVVCDKCERCVDGQCVSTCLPCQTCDTSTINGTCVDKCTGGGSVSPVTCGQCQSCVCGECVVTGQLCGSPIVTCCTASECCVNGTCVPCDCTGLNKPTACHVCQSGQYVSSCTAGQECCNGVCCPAGKRCCNNACKECCNDGHCPSGKVCSNGVCVTPACCIEIPACDPTPQLFVRSSCSPYTLSYGGEPCEVSSQAATCEQSQCTYEWAGSSWTFVGCAIDTTGLFAPYLLLPGYANPSFPGCQCAAGNCPSPNTIPPPATSYPYYFGVNCTSLSNPLP